MGRSSNKISCNLHLASTCLLNPHFFAGEECAWLDAQEFSGSTLPVDFPVGAFQGGFDVVFFPEAHTFVGEHFVRIVAIFLDGSFQ